MPTTVSDSLQIVRFARGANNAAQFVPKTSTDVTGMERRETSVGDGTAKQC
jgi:hypothetical protein